MLARRRVPISLCSTGPSNRRRISTWVTGCRRSSPGPATPAPPAWATARAWPRTPPRIEAIGAVDELNSTLGLLLSETLPEACASVLTDAQHDLFDLGGELSIPGHVAVTDAHVLRLEAAVERFNADLSPLKEFILPAERVRRASRILRAPCAGARSARWCDSH